MKSFKETRFFGCIALTAVFLLVGIWGWFAFTALPAVNVPNPALPKPNAFDTIQQAIAAKVVPPSDLQKQLYGSYATKPPTGPFPTAKAEAWLKQNENALQLLRQGLKQEYREPPQRSMLAAMPSYYGGFRELARLLSAESNIRAHRGDWKGAADSALDDVHFGYQIQHGAPLIGGLVGYAVQSIGRKAVQNTLPHLDAAKCRQIARRLEALHNQRTTFSEVLTEEKWFRLATLLENLKLPGGVGFQATPTRSKFLPIRFISRRRLITEDTAYMDAVIASAKQPYKTAAVPVSPNSFFTDSTAPVFARARWNDARNAASHTMLMLGFTLRAYQLEHASYPDTLAQLAPQYITKVPDDPFGAGETLRYKKTGDTFLLWSIGSDKIDDGGKAIDNPKPPRASLRRFMQPESKGDFVFGVNR